MSRPVVVAAVSLLAFLAAALLAFSGPLTRERVPVASTGAPPPFTERTPIDVGPGAQVCAVDVVIPPRARVAEVIADAGKGRIPDLVLEASGPGYRAPPVPVPGGTPGGLVLRIPFTAPRETVRGQVCLRNAGDAPIALTGTTELRTQTALQTTVEGQPVPADLSLTLFEDRAVSALGFLPRIVDYATAFRGFLGAGWLAWTLLVLVAAGAPLAVFWTLLRALQRDSA